MKNDSSVFRSPKQRKFTIILISARQFSPAMQI